MASVPIVPLYSKSQVENAGKLLATEILESQKQDAIEAFKIAHNWRDAHVRPLRLIRAELVGKLKSARTVSPTAARLKRMKSIRGKLARGRLTLYQMQDVGGCRVILPTVNDVAKISAEYRNGNGKHAVVREDNYVERPKPDGYRCCHLIFKFNGVGDDAVYNRQKFEMQVRTRLQHAWATAVEAVGLYRGEDLKGGIGNPDWLRFFQLVSSEFATEEGGPIVDGTPTSSGARRRGLRQLDKKLSAIKTLRMFNEVVQYSEDFFVADAEYFLIQYDGEAQSLVVSPYNRYSPIANAYIHEERAEDITKKTAVLVEVDAIEDLKAAYPNYFLDVDLFLQKLDGILV